MTNVRVRFAPSPTGPLHIGGVRTALYNYLFAKKHRGSFIIRIEDTDQKRYVEGAEAYILEALHWCGITPDEGPEQGGEFGPYRQSERKSIYAQYALGLVDEGKAYYAFDTPAELETMREKLKEAKVSALHYNAITRTKMNNSLTLSASEVAERINSGEPYVIRLNVPQKSEIRFKDAIRGWIMVQSSTLDDKVILKSDGMPTYHLANIVDDHLMKISHVIRGEEWLPSAPLHVLLYQMLGWQDTQPEFAHLPLLLKPEGPGKLSKRDAEKHGFPIFPLEWTDSHSGEKLDGFREGGYLATAFINFLAFLGWNPGGEQEIFDLADLTKAFSLERIGKSGAKFDIEKAKWFNQHYIRKQSDEALAKELRSHMEANSHPCGHEKALMIVAIMKDRITFASDLWENGSFFFLPPSIYDEKVVEKKWTQEATAILDLFKNELRDIDPFEADPLKEKLHDLLEKHSFKIGAFMPTLRLSLTGQGSGPDLFAIMETLGHQETVNRINTALRTLGDKVKI